MWSVIIYTLTWSTYKFQGTATECWANNWNGKIYERSHRFKIYEWRTFFHLLLLLGVNQQSLSYKFCVVMNVLNHNNKKWAHTHKKKWTKIPTWHCKIYCCLVWSSYIYFYVALPSSCLLSTLYDIFFCISKLVK